MADLKTLCIDGECRDIPQGGGAVSGVKGNAESSYRTGDVNLTPANIGAVNKEGDEMTGELRYKVNSADASKANNNIPSGSIYPTTFNILDTAGRIMGRVETVVDSSGNISTYMYARNYNTSGTQVAQKGIRVTVKKDGTSQAYCEADKPSAGTSDAQIATTAFTQDAITRRLPKSQNVNWSGSTKSIPNASEQYEDVWTAPSNGMLIAKAQCIFASNATGGRGFYVNVGGTNIGGLRVTANSSGPMDLPVTVAKRMNSGEKIRLRYQQTSGGALNLTYRGLQGYFIPD